jgi:hypothetical protein
MCAAAAETFEVTRHAKYDQERPATPSQGRLGRKEQAKQQKRGGNKCNTKYREDDYIGHITFQCSGEIENVMETI